METILTVSFLIFLASCTPAYYVAPTGPGVAGVDIVNNAWGLLLLFGFEKSSDRSGGKLYFPPTSEALPNGGKLIIPITENKQFSIALYYIERENLLPDVCRYVLTFTPLTHSRFA